jgi:hypothetical protein
MSRKFGRTKRLKYEASDLVAQILADPKFIAQLFRPKSRWIPRFVWKLLFKTLVRTQ